MRIKNGNETRSGEFWQPGIGIPKPDKPAHPVPTVNQLLLIIFGVFGFLPMLGFWMVPLGALLLAQDIPFLRRPILRALVWLEGKWIKWKRRPRP